MDKEISIKKVLFTTSFNPDMIKDIKMLALKRGTHVNELIELEFKRILEDDKKSDLNKR